MNIQLSVVREIAVPLADYPHISSNAPLSDAIALLMFHRSANGAHIHFDEVLVTDQEGKFTGELQISTILDHFFRPALQPPASNLVAENGAHLAEIIPVIDEWFTARCRRHSEIKVARYMTSHQLSVEPSTHVLHALGFMLNNMKTMLPVTENNILQGAVRIEDIFKILGKGHTIN